MGGEGIIYLKSIHNLLGENITPWILKFESLKVTNTFVHSFIRQNCAVLLLQAELRAYILVHNFIFTLFEDLKWW